MGATVEKVEQKKFTDASEYFYQGMKREEVEGKYSLFISDEEIFNSIDKDYDGVLSRAEITSELENDIEHYKDNLELSVFGGILNAGIGILTNKIVSPRLKKFTLFATAMSIVCALHNKLKIDELQKRMVQGYN